VTRFHEVSADLPAEAGLGVALTAQHAKPRYPYAHRGEWRRGQAHRASGRRRTAVVSAMMKMLRAYDWSRLVA